MTRAEVGWMPPTGHIGNGCDSTGHRRIVRTRGPKRRSTPGMPTAAMLAADLRAMQAERYSQWGAVAVAFARAQDRTAPLWSTTHRLRRTVDGGQIPDGTERQHWVPDWEQSGLTFIHGDWTYAEFARLSGIWLSHLEGAAARFGWSESKRTWKMLLDREREHVRLAALHQAAREVAIRETFTETGLNLLRHAMTVMTDPERLAKMQVRDVPMLIREAARLIGAGERMPIEHTHNTQEPRLDAVRTTIAQQNVVNVTAEAPAELLADLNRRAALLLSAAAVPIPTARPTAALPQERGEAVP